MYPRMQIHLDRIARNARAVQSICRTRGLAFTAITKSVCGDQEIAALLCSLGIQQLGDARIQNLQKYVQLPVEKWLIRIPMISECREVVRFADVSLVSEKATLQALNREALAQKKTHGVLLMLDMGDRREGCFEMREMISLLKEVDRLSNLELKGFGTNLGCFGFVQTNGAKMQDFSRVIQNITKSSDLIISGGNSSSLKWVMEAKDLYAINHLRLGESILFGRERRDFTQLEQTTDDAFLLETELVEVKEKPSLPDGVIGMDSYGNAPVFHDYGMHLRGICAIGKQDIDPDLLEPTDSSIHILGSSFDHMIVELPRGHYRVGDILQFKMRYGAVVRAMTSEYISKQYIRKKGICE